MATCLYSALREGGGWAGVGGQELLGTYDMFFSYDFDVTQARPGSLSQGGG